MAANEKPRAPVKKPDLLKMTTAEYKAMTGVAKVEYTMASMTWFRNKLKKSAITREDIQREVRHSWRLEPGQMLFFKYDAKYKEELPYWDAFPLIILFEVTNTHFRGINLHYLHPLLRQAIFLELMRVTSNKFLTPNKKMRVTWDLLKNLANDKFIKHATKLYLKDHVKSQPNLVRSDEWVSAIFLEVSDFQKKSKEFVWRDI